MQIRIISIRQYAPVHNNRLRESLSHFLHSVNSAEFQDLILQHRPFITDDQLTNLQIYDRIMAGREVGTPRNNIADLDLTLDYRHSTDRVGYTRNRSIFTYRNIFESSTPVFLAGHYAHEYCHTLGGFPDPDDLSDTSRNVPYEVGRIISLIASGGNLRINLIKRTPKTGTLKNKPTAKKATKKKSASKKAAKKKAAKNK